MWSSTLRRERRLVGISEIRPRVTRTAHAPQSTAHITGGTLMPGVAPRAVVEHNCQHAQTTAGPFSSCTSDMRCTRRHERSHGCDGVSQGERSGKKTRHVNVVQKDPTSTSSFGPATIHPGPDTPRSTILNGPSSYSYRISGSHPSTRRHDI